MNLDAEIAEAMRRINRNIERRYLAAIGRLSPNRVAGQLWSRRWWHKRVVGQTLHERK